MKKTVIAYVHSHWDREWYREFEEFRLRLIEVVDKVVQELETGKIPVFYFDGQTAAVEDYLEIYPEKEAVIKKLIAEKKLYVGPFYCSSDSFLTSCESMVRNLCFGIKKSKELGCSEFLGYLSDTFGHSASIPSVLKSFDIDKAAMWRGLGDLPSELLWDGVKVTNLIQGYFNDFLNLNVSVVKQAEFLKVYLDKITARSSSDNILLPIGADHLCPASDLKNKIKEINKYLKGYEIKIATPFEYFEAVKNVKRKEIKGELLDNSLTFILPGVYSSRVDLKRENTVCEWNLQRVVEPIQALSNFALGTKSYQNEIDYAYKTLIKNHAHDSIYGCSIDNVSKDVLARFRNVEIVSNGIEKRVLRDLSGKSDDISVINLSNFEYSGLVKVRTHKKLDKKYNATLLSKEKGFIDEKLYNKNEIPVTEDYQDIYTYLIETKGLKPFSTTKLESKNIESKRYLKASKNSIENEVIKFEIKGNKVFLTDKKTGEIYKDFLNFIDRADIGDSYNFGALKGDTKIKSSLVSYKIVKNPKFLALDMVFELKIPKTSTEKGRSKTALTHKIKVKAILHNSTDYAEFDIQFENKAKNHILQAEILLKEPVKTTIADDMISLCERNFDPDFDIYKKIPAPRGIEIKPNTAPMQKFVWAQGVGIVTEGLKEYEVFKNNLLITLIRATGTISNPKNPTRGTPAGPPLETPDLQILGENRARFAITFKKEAKELFKTSESFFNPCMTLFANVQNKQFFELDNKNILVHAVKSSGKDLIVRLVNISNKKQTLNIKINIPYSKIFESNSLEKNIKEINGKIEFEPKQIKSIKITK